MTASTPPGYRTGDRAEIFVEVGGRSRYDPALRFPRSGESDMALARACCPRCGKVFRAEVPTGPEATFRCPGCRAVFPAPPAAPQISAEERAKRKAQRRPQAASATGRRTGLVIALVLGGTFICVCLPVTGIGLWWFLPRKAGSAGESASASPLEAMEKAVTGNSASSNTRKLLVGTWECTEKPRGAGRRPGMICFNDDGTVHLETGQAQLGETFKSLGMVAEFEIHVPDRCITYRLLDDEHLEMTVELILHDKGAQDYHGKETVTFAVSEKELSVTNEKGKTTKFRRIE